MLTQAGTNTSPLRPDRPQPQQPQHQHPQERLTSCGRMLLAELCEAMTAAQVEVANQRRQPSDANLLAMARNHHVATMIAYEEALNALHLPVPPRLRDDLRLLRRVVRL